MLLKTFFLFHPGLAGLLGSTLQAIPTLTPPRHCLTPERNVPERHCQAVQAGHRDASQSKSRTAHDAHGVRIPHQRVFLPFSIPHLSYRHLASVPPSFRCFFVSRSLMVIVFTSLSLSPTRVRLHYDRPVWVRDLEASVSRG